MYKVAILPELLGRWFTRSDAMPTIDDRGDSIYNYCYCKEEVGCVMNHCGNNKCPHGEWFHLKSFKLKNASCTKQWHFNQCHKELKQEIKLCHSYTCYLNN